MPDTAQQCLGLSGSDRRFVCELGSLRYNRVRPLALMITRAALDKKHESDFHMKVLGGLLMVIGLVVRFLPWRLAEILAIAIILLGLACMLYDFNRPNRRI